MIKFLIRRPIAVIMSFTALFVLGIITYCNVPTSLLPSIAIPEVTIKIDGGERVANELEQLVVRPLRQELLQVTGINDIESQTKDRDASIRLLFDYGTNIDLATIEVNEKIDAAMNRLPGDVPRPLVIKSRASDIPVFNLCITLQNDSTFVKSETQRFLELSEFSSMVIKRRIEQLPQVAMVDVTGVADEKIEILVNRTQMKIMGLKVSNLEEILNSHNMNPGTVRVRDGFYEYEIRFATAVRSIEDIENILINHQGRMLRLKEIAQVERVPQEEEGLAFANGKRAVIMSVIKHSRENMEDMKSALEQLLSVLRHDYPEIEFTIMQNQTELLDYTISNLQQNLLIGFVLICFVSILFLGDIRSPIAICGSMFVSLVICFLFFYIFNITLNIISISGLILALGMMIDSSIIVTDNITQYRNQNLPLEKACIKGTSEVIIPMLSSTFTTIAVFVPLVFMSGMAGALFFDQAFAVTVGLLVSYVCGIILLPVLYKLVYSIPSHNKFSSHSKVIFDRFDKGIIRLYDLGIEWVFRHKTTTLGISIALFGCCYLLYTNIPKTKMPALDYVESIVRIDWNENIHLEENEKRINTLTQEIAPHIESYSGYIGRQQFVLNKQSELSRSEAEFYIKVRDVKALQRVETLLSNSLNRTYPLSSYTFSPPPTVFERIFRTDEEHLVAELQRDNQSDFSISEMNKIKNEIEQQCNISLMKTPLSEQVNIHIDPWAKHRYGVSQDEITTTLRTAFNDYRISNLHSNTHSLPIYIHSNKESLEQTLNTSFVHTEKGDVIPLKHLISQSQSQDLKVIHGGKLGKHIPLVVHTNNEEKTMNTIKQVVSRHNGWNVAFSGTYFSNSEMLKELLVILIISLLMMYFILASQFESFVQPLIVLFEIPIDIAASLAILYLFGHSLNLMSAIGIIVTCGIIINDSILKLDIINKLRKQGCSIIEAVHTAGRRRLRSILMTSLTTILAMVPLLFASDMGSELQKPLAIATIAGMTIGTLVSLFIIPLIYWLIHKNKESV